MHTQDRLTQAYEEARVVEYDASSKFVFISDTHRGDGSRADEFSPNQSVFSHMLRHYDEEGYTLVEVGDCEDLWEFPHVKHIVRAHGIVYEELRKFHREGRYIRLYGNHDHQLSDPTYVVNNMSEYLNAQTGHLEPLFPGLEVLGSLVLRNKETGQDLLVVHGHQGDFANDQAWRGSMFMFRTLWRWLHAFGVKSPTSPIRNTYKRHRVERNYVKWIRTQQVALLCGHTHRAKCPAPDETPYFNTGAGTFNGYVTCIELTNGALSLARWRVEPDANGYLHCVRFVRNDPTPLEAVDRRTHPGLTPEQEKERYLAMRAASRKVTRRSGRPF